MSKIQKANLYFLFIMVLTIVIPQDLLDMYLYIGIRDVRIIQFLNHVILFLVPAIIYVIATKMNIKETFKLNKIYLKDFFMLIAIIALCYPLMGFIGTISSMFFENNIGNFMGAIVETPYIVLVLLMAVTPAITEEITLRGIVLSGYDKVSRFKAALVTGILFGIFHMDLQQLVYAAVLGFIFAYIVRVTNSIWAGVLMHFSINGISVTIQKLVFSAQQGIVQGEEEFDLVSMALGEKLTLIGIYLIFILILGTLIFKLIKKLEKWNIERGVIEAETRGKGDKVINWSLLLIVGIYLAAMINKYFI